jgi:hypothetical protein
VEGTDKLPRAQDSEEYIAGVLWQFPECAGEVFERLKPTDIIDPAIRQIFTVAHQQHFAGGIDRALLAKQCGHPQVLADLGVQPENAPVTSAHIPAECAKIVEARRKRQLFEVADDARRAALNGQSFDTAFRSLSADLEDIGRDNRRTVELIQASTIEQRSIDWAWPGWLHRGGLTLIDGDPERGKSTITANVVACWTKPRPFPFAPHDHFREPGNALVVAGEDGAATTTAPRLNAAGANLDRVWIWPEDADLIRFPSGIDRLAAAVSQRDISLIILDPITAYLDEDINANRDADVRRALRPLVVLAQETNIAVIGIRHLNKDSNKSALYRGGGSIGFTATARVVWAVGADPNDPKKSIMGVLKSNIGKKPPSLAYSVESHEDTSRVKWESESSYSANDILGQAKGRGAKTEDAEQYIRELLAAGARPSSEVEKLCADAGFKGWTYKQARKNLGVVSSKGSMREGWLSSLPEEDGFEGEQPEEDGSA